VGRMNYAQHPPAAPTDGRTRSRLSPIASIARIDVKHVEIHKAAVLSRVDVTAVGPTPGPWGK